MTRRAWIIAARYVASFAAALIVAIHASGCSSTDSLTERPVSSGAFALDDLAQPAVRGATNGLEMRVWAVQDQDELVAELIESFGNRPTPMPDSVREAWRASGLRVLSVPAEELAMVRDRLQLIGPEQRDWFGQSPTWAEAVRGRLIEAGTAMRVADGVLIAPAGRLRLLMRCWTVPGLPAGARGIGAALHLELAAQLERRDAAESLLKLPSMRSELEAGVVFPGLTGTMQLMRGNALVIVPVGPGFDMESAAGIGPPEPSVPTLGEAMLTSLQPNSTTPAHRRAIVALLPRLPERFEVVSGSASAADLASASALP